MQHISAGFFHLPGYQNAAIQIRFIAPYTAGDDEIQTDCLADPLNSFGCEAGSIDNVSTVFVFPLIYQRGEKLAD
jgi:hypothetical protein